MTKKQKIWLWIFIAMFAIPEILFFNIISFLVLFFGEKIPNAFSLIFSDNYLLDYLQFLIIVAVEFIGALGLFIISVKSKRKILAIILGIILLLLLLIFVLFSNLSNANWLM